MGETRGNGRVAIISRARPWTAALVLPALVGVLGAWIGMTVAGSRAVHSGPFTLRLSADFGSGSTVVALPPLGRLTADTHTAPLRLTATLSAVDARSLVRYVRARTAQQATAEIRADVLHSVGPFAWWVLLTAVAGGLLLALVVYRTQWRRIVVAGVAVVVVVGGSEAAAWQTYRPAALLSPKFSGSLALAPGLIGPIRTATDRINDFSGELQRIVEGTTRVFTKIESNPLGGGDEIRILHISDVHLSPLGLKFALEIARAFDVDLVMDTGDLTSFGTPVEDLITRFIPSFRVPYVWVRGNHDSRHLQRRMRHIPNVTVLDGSTATMEGIEIYGVGDTFFTPDKAHIPDEDQRTDLIDEANRRVLSDLEALPEPPDVVMIHNDAEGIDAAGRVSLVISGHYHQFAARAVDGTLFLRVGSTGGSGAGVFSRQGGVPLAAEILHFDRTTGALIGYDRIEQFPESGDVTLDRHIVQDEFGTLVPSPSPTSSPEPAARGTPTA